MKKYFILFLIAVACVSLAAHLAYALPDACNPGSSDIYVLDTDGSCNKGVCGDDGHYGYVDADSSNCVFAITAGGASSGTIVGTRPVLTWTPSLGATYYIVQVSDKADFSNIVFQKQVTGNTVTVGQ